MAPSLCENCYKRPKFGTHRFCGKTCAAQATIPLRSRQLPPQGKAGTRDTGRQKGVPAPQNAVRLCKYCGQKPRFNGFDYCGKSCAALAGITQTKPPVTQGIPTTRQKTTRLSNAPSNHASAPSSTIRHKAPQDDSAEEEEDEDEEGGVFTDLDGYPSDSGSDSEDEPSAPQVAVPQLGAKSTSKGGKPGGGAPRVVPGICAIPGCGQPAHIDRHGEQTLYCSMKHREEAVKLGLEAACIMCKRYPQSTSNYFCSSACRNQSMTKT